MIEIHNVIKRFGPNKHNSQSLYGRQNAVDGVSMSIEANRTTIIKGPNGAGKTTLLSILGGMSRPTSGRVVIDNNDISSLPEKFLSAVRRKYFGFVFQSYNLIKGISVVENVMLPAYPTNKKPALIKDQAMKLLEKLHVISKAKQKIELLSGGEQQRVAIARALINDPQIIIADEPTAHLHSDSIADFLIIVSDLIAEGKSVIISSHNPLLFEAGIVDRRIELIDGKIVGDEKINPRNVSLK